MTRALLPWSIPLAILLAVGIAATGSVVVWAVGLILLGWVVLPLGLRSLQRSDTPLPRSVRMRPPD